VDAVCPKRSRGLSVGTYLQAVAINRAVAPRSKRGFGHWVASSVLDRQYS
jgi:hypothetical protein